MRTLFLSLFAVLSVGFAQSSKCLSQCESSAIGAKVEVSASGSKTYLIPAQPGRIITFSIQADDFQKMVVTEEHPNKGWNVSINENGDLRLVNVFVPSDATQMYRGCVTVLTKAGAATVCAVPSAAAPLNLVHVYIP